MQHCLQIPQGLTTDCRHCRWLQSATNRRIEHPFRDLQESTFEALFYATEEQSTPIPGKGTVDRHHAVVPRMPRVTDFSRFSTILWVLRCRLVPRGPNPSRSGEGHARGACCSIGISEREQDYLDAQTWWAASPLHSRGLSVPIPTIEFNVPEKICAATRANSHLHGKPSLNSLLTGNALPLARPQTRDKVRLAGM